MDTERPQLASEPVLVLSVWEALCEDACFESSWPSERLPCLLGLDCCVQVHLDSLGQSLNLTELMGALASDAHVYVCGPKPLCLCSSKTLP